MPKNNPLRLVPLDAIPKAVDARDVPLDEPIEALKLCLRMADLCLREDGIGLSAFQVGVPWRLFVVLRQKGYSDRPHFDYYANCEYTPVPDSPVQQSVEGCLSLRGPGGGLRHFRVDRHKEVRVQGLQLVADPELSFVPVDFVVGGLYGIVFQHEIDHQSGILISDIGKELELR